MKLPLSLYFKLLFIIFWSNISAQSLTDTFEKEKTYVQTNHVYYIPGETVFFKIYVINGEDNTIADKSKIVYAQWIEPSGNIKKTYQYPIENGFATGSIYLDENIVGGIYRLKVYTNWMQNETGKNYYEKEIHIQKIVSPRILMKLDFPKKGYAAGDEVLAEFSMRSLSDQPIGFYSVNYSVFVDGEEISKNTFITDKNGKYHLTFNLPKVLQSNDGLLNVKVNYDGFDEAISKNIPIVLNKIDLKFFPESGQLIDGLETNLAFKALDEFGKPVDVKGVIYDENNQIITDFSAYRFGMGLVKLKPNADNLYYAKITTPLNALIFQLPKVQENGVIINVLKEDNAIKLNLQSTTNRKITLIGSTHNIYYFEKEITLAKGDNVIDVETKNFPMGIARFSVFENQIPLTERIVFLNPEKKLQVNLHLDKKYYRPREKVTLEIETKDQDGNPISSNLGLSVVDDKLWTYADDKQDHIISWLLMSSELSGSIIEPNFYFKKDEPQAQKSLDLLMLTNGYRYFELKPNIVDSQKIEFLPEQLNGIYGNIYNENKNPIEADVYLVETSSYDKSEKIWHQSTQKDGFFYFKNLNPNSVNRIIAKAKTPKQKIDIKILSYDLNVNPIAKNENIKNIEVDEIVKENLESKIQKNDPKNNTVTTTTKNYIKNSGRKVSDTTMTQNIEEAVLIGYSTKKSMSNTTIVTNNDLPNTNNLNEILSGRVAGLEIASNSGFPGNANSVVIRGVASISSQQKPLYILDGVPVDHFTTTINPQDINSITILKDATATAIYGSRGANGVIIINSKINKNLKNSKFQINITPKTYYALTTINSDSLKQFDWSRKFSYPIYDKIATAYRFDFRESIYWNPVIQTNQKGKAKVEFYNSDATTTFRIMTEGISSNGLIGREEKTYAANSTISVDAKITPYLTMGDNPIIPLVIKNNAANTKSFQIHPNLPKHITLKPFDSISIIRPLEAKRLLYSLETGKAIKGEINFMVTTEEDRETTVFPINVEKKGFIHQFIIEGDTLDSYQFSFPDDVIRGSISGNLSIYRNYATKMLGNLSALTKEPYGCFEQLSSTIYPNVFILDFQKKSGNLTDSYEKSAIRKLKIGYNKLTAFEIENGGFGYFNASEPDIAISAFALSEFLHLKKYVNVRSGLINRITNYILSQKTGAGTFRTINYNYNHYYNNELPWAKQAYILYSISKTEMKNEIEKEYQTSLSRIRNTKDSYQAALLANAAYNLQKNQDYEELMKLLKNQIENNTLKSGSGMTGSTGKSLSAETLALYIIALFKNASHNQDQIKNAVIQLNKNYNYYGYGSTQGTALALEALSEYYLYQKIDPNAKINFIFNGKDLENKLKDNNELDITDLLEKDNILKVITEKNNNIPFSLSWDYSSLTPPTNDKSVIEISTTLAKPIIKISDINRMKVEIKNTLSYQLPMVTAKIGIPAGLSLQPSILKAMIDKKQFSYYEIFDNYLVLYWESIDPKEIKTINLDLKAEFPGQYSGKASNVYLYYTPENKHWTPGNTVVVEDTAE